MAASLKEQINEDPSDMYIEAANMEKKYNPHGELTWLFGSSLEYLPTIEKGIKKYCEAGKFSHAARYKAQIAEVLENEKEYLEAAKYYNEAFDLYQMEGEPSMQESLMNKFYGLDLI